MKGSEIVSILDGLASKFDPNDKEAAKVLSGIEEAKRCISLCPACQGRGVVYYTNHVRPGDHRARRLQSGGIGALYEYPCLKCNGKGQRIKAKCSSCLSEFDMESRPRPGQIEMIFMDDMCDICYESRNAKIGLVPVEPNPQVSPNEETKKLEVPPTTTESKTNENPKQPKLKGGKR